MKKSPIEWKLTNGQAWHHGQYLGPYEGTTRAVSFAQAYNNFTFRAKKNFGLPPNSTLWIEGDITPVKQPIACYVGCETEYDEVAVQLKLDFTNYGGQNESEKNI